MSVLPNPRRGTLLMVLAALAFTVMAALVKDARAEMSPIALIFWRGLLTIPLTAWLAWSVGFRVQNTRVLALRSVLGFCAMTCWFTAAVGLPLTTLSLIGKLQPLMLAVLAPLVLGASELLRGGARSAVLVGLVGCALIIGPELTLGGHYGLLALGGTTCSALAHLCLRHLGKTESPATVVFWFQVAVTIFAMILLTALGDWHQPPPALWGHLIGIAVFATVGQIAMTRAYQLDQAARVAIASYTAPLWSMSLDLVVFTELPGPIALFGGVLVVGSGLMVLTPEAKIAPS